VHGLITASATSAWSYGASILTFVFPELLFIAVAAALYVLYTKPHLVPGHHYEMRNRATAHTTAPAVPGTDGLQAPAAAVDTGGVAGTAPGESDNEV
jgi:hypothetical protein